MNDHEIMQTIKDVHRQHGNIATPPYLQRKCKITADKAKALILRFKMSIGEDIHEPGLDVTFGDGGSIKMTGGASLKFVNEGATLTIKDGKTTFES